MKYAKPSWYVCLASLLLISAAGCIYNSKSSVCADGRVCPADMKCTASVPSRCIATGCGDGIVQEGEQCDPGGLDDIDSCNRDCTVARCGDGKLNQMAGEECDGDGQGHGGETATCNGDCHFSKCGDERVNHAAGEQCDRGAANDDQGDCNTNCQSTSCGDGVRNTNGPYGFEECDDGDKNSDHADCTKNCRKAACGDGLVDSDGVKYHEECDFKADSTGKCTTDCKWNICGDGFTLDGEECDDKGATSGLNTCGYNLVCTKCADCKIKTIRGPYCGDGIVSNGEICDYSKSSTCGTCVTSCSSRLATKAATGYIQVIKAALVEDGDYFVLSDGTDSVKFQFYYSVPPASPVKGIQLLGTMTEIPLANAIHSAIRSVQKPGVGTGKLEAIQLAAFDNTKPLVQLSNANGLAGNQPILIDRSSRSSFSVSGISGGVGCGLGVPCNDDEDCVSGKCSTGTGTHTCVAP